MNKTLYFTFLFFFFLFLQVFVLNNILLFGFINPYLYISFIFLYPLRKNRFNLLFISFLLGLGIDLFSDTGGIHAFASVFIAYFRLFFIKLFFTKLEADYPFFKLKSEPFGKIFNFVLTLTILHHFLLFAFANFSFENFSEVMLNTLYSSIFTLLLFFTGSYIFTKDY